MNQMLPPPPEDNIPLPLLHKSPVPVFVEEDDEPTVKMRIPPHLMEMSRRGPNWGLLIALGFCLAFWGSVVYLFWHAHG